MASEQSPQPTEPEPLKAVEIQGSTQVSRAATTREVQRPVQTLQSGGAVIALSRTSSEESMSSPRDPEKANPILSTEIQEKEIEVRSTPFEKTTNPKKATVTVVENEIPEDLEHQLEEATNERLFGFLNVSQNLTWAVLIVLPLLFIGEYMITQQRTASGLTISIVLAGYMVVIDGQPANSFDGAAVQQAIKVAVSIWPIVFAAIIAHSLHALASFRSERGVKLIVSQT